MKNRFETAILKWNFKKISVAYTVAAVIATVVCAVIVALVFRTVFTFAWHCGEVRDNLEKGNEQGVSAAIDQLAAFPDVVDVVFLDGENHVTRTWKHSRFAKENFSLMRCTSQREYYFSANDPQVVFMPVEHGEIVFTLIFSSTFSHDDRDPYEGSCNKTVNLLLNLGEQNATSRIFLISTGDEIPYGKGTIYGVILVILFFLLVNQVLLALWAYQNALKAKLSPVFWGLVVLFSGTIGALIYLLYKRRYRHIKQSP
ncbi:MAG TPA: hypothetical protein PKD52_08670 [Clostridiales bacterium]|nr:hypothetical protein [Clostridiales bacterium]